MPTPEKAAAIDGTFPLAMSQFVVSQEEVLKQKWVQGALSIGVTFVILSALFAISNAIVKRVLYVRRYRKIDATAAWFIRHYSRLLDESALNPNRRHLDGTR